MDFNKVIQYLYSSSMIIQSWNNITEQIRNKGNTSKHKAAKERETLPKLHEVFVAVNISLQKN